MIARRELLLGSVLLLASCSRKPRCRRCGMVLDPKSRWLVTMTLADGSTEQFDTPKCAFFTLRSGEREKGAKLVFKSYYGQKTVDEGALVFAKGSDVLGPMGEDLVPVEPELAQKFKVEHKAKEMLKAADVTKAIVEAM